MAWYDPPVSTANPNDPSQLRNWGLGLAQSVMNRGLYDNISGMQGTLNPYFQQAQTNYANQFGGQMNSQIGQAQNQAGAFAAYKGLNPLAYSNSAAQKVRSSMTPSFTSGYKDLLSNQNQQLLGATAQDNQSRNQNAMQAAQMMMNGSQQAQQTWEQPGFWDYLGSGLLNGLSSLGEIAGSLYGGGTSSGSGTGNQMYGNSGNRKG
jgi:hypothetical protein